MAIAVFVGVRRAEIDLALSTDLDDIVEATVLQTMPCRTPFMFRLAIRGGVVGENMAPVYGHRPL